MPLYGPSGRCPARWLSGRGARCEMQNGHNGEHANGGLFWEEHEAFRPPLSGHGHTQENRKAHRSKARAEARRAR
jgi:hypothetical protein